MKHLLFITLEDTDETSKVLRELSNKGFNATIQTSTSLKHAVKEEEMEDIPLFISLHSIEKMKKIESVSMFLVVNDENIENIKTLIREGTNNFTTTRGMIAELDIKKFEGSF